MTGQDDVLDAGPPPRPRWRTAALVALLLALGVAAAVLDRSHRERESEEVASCREQGAAEIAGAFARLTARTGTVRPTVFALPDGALRDRLLGLVGEAVADADDRLRAAGSRCAEVRVLWHHGELDQRRDACVVALEGLADWFREVSRDGAHAFGGGAVGRGDCDP